MANSNSPRITLDRLGWGTLPDGHKLRTIFSQQGIQDTLFGRNSPGGLDRNDYDSMQVLVGTVITHESQARMTPLQCQTLDRTIVPPRICGTESTGNTQVRRCEGSRVDPGNNFPGNAVLAYHPRRWRWQDAREVKRWTQPTTRVPHPTWPKPTMCTNCERHVRVNCRAQRLFESPYNSPMPNRRRWARFCKQHCMELRNQFPTRWPQRAYINYNLDCCCEDAASIGGTLWSCDRCLEITDNAWVDRAQHWREELLHTYVRQKRARRRIPYVDMTKPARAQPACPWKNCGKRPWIAPLGQDEDGEEEFLGEAENIGLSLCLGCSFIVRM